LTLNAVRGQIPNVTETSFLPIDLSSKFLIDNV